MRRRYLRPSLSLPEIYLYRAPVDFRKQAQGAYSRPRLPLIPDEACHPFHAKAATDSTATLPPRQAA